MALNTASVMSEAQVDLMNQAVIVSGEQYNKIDAYATIREDINANSIAFTVFSRLDNATTPLTDGTDVDSTSLSFTKVDVTPAEYGAVVTSTSLANLTTGGKTDLAGAELVGINLGSTTDRLGIASVEAGTNTVDTNGTISSSALRTAYKELSADGIAKFANGRYVAFMHPNDIALLKDTHQELVKYTDADSALSGRIGYLEGFDIVESANCTSGTIVAFGKNALGKAVSQSPEMRITDGNDSLGRLLNIGWYGVISYSIIDNNAVRVLKEVV